MKLGWTLMEGISSLTCRPHWKVRPESGTAQSSESQSSLAFSIPLSTAMMPASAQKSALFGKIFDIFYNCDKLQGVGPRDES